MTTPEKSVNEIRKEVALYFYNINHPEVYSSEEVAKYEKDVDYIMKIITQTLQAERTKREEMVEAEREKIKTFVEKDWVFPPPDITGYQTKNSRPELPAQYVRRMVLDSLLPKLQALTNKTE